MGLWSGPYGDCVALHGQGRHNGARKVRESFQALLQSHTPWKNVLDLMLRDVRSRTV